MSRIVNYRTLWRIALLIAPVISSGIAHAAPLQTVTTAAGTMNGLPVSNSDLFQTNLASVNVTGYSPFVSGTSFGNPNPVLINGSAQGNTTATSDWPNLVLEDTTGGRDALWSAVFNLDVTSSPTGYSIAEIDTFAGWSDSRAGQVYDLYLSKVGDPTFYQVASGLGGALGNSFGAAFNNGASKIAITDPSGFLGIGIDAIRFDINGNLTSGPVFREFDAFGVATTPEPTTIVLWSMMGMLGIAIYCTRRKR